MPSRIYNHQTRDKINQKRVKASPKVDRELLLRSLELDSGKSLTDLRQWQELPPSFPFEWNDNTQEYTNY
jgi:hypothetical protein